MNVMIALAVLYYYYMHLKSRSLHVDSMQCILTL